MPASHLNYSFYFTNYISSPLFYHLPLNVYVYFFVAGVLLAAICWRPHRFSSCAVWGALGGLALILLVQTLWQQHYWKGRWGPMLSRIMNREYVRNGRLRTGSLTLSCSTRQEMFHVMPYLILIPGTSDMSYTQELWCQTPKTVLLIACLFLKWGHPLVYVPVGFDRVLWYDSQSLMALKGPKGN